jgi:hypothetical protein
MKLWLWFAQRHFVIKHASQFDPTLYKTNDDQKAAHCVHKNNSVCKALGKECTRVVDRKCSLISILKFCYICVHEGRKGVWHDSALGGIFRHVIAAPTCFPCHQLRHVIRGHRIPTESIDLWTRKLQLNRLGTSMKTRSLTSMLPNNTAPTDARRLL